MKQDGGYFDIVSNIVMKQTFLKEVKVTYCVLIFNRLQEIIAVNESLTVASFAQ